MASWGSRLVSEGSLSRPDSLRRASEHVVLVNPLPRRELGSHLPKGSLSLRKERGVPGAAQQTRLPILNQQKDPRQAFPGLTELRLGVCSLQPACPPCWADLAQEAKTM